MLSGKTLATGTTYLKGVVCFGTKTDGAVRFYDGTSDSDTLIFEVSVPKNANNVQTVRIPDPGLLCTTGLHVTFPEGYNVTTFYGK